MLSTNVQNFSTLTKEVIQLPLSDRNGSLTIYLPLLFLSPEQSLLPNKSSGKSYLIDFVSPSSTKMIFALLAEVITPYIGLTTI